MINDKRKGGFTPLENKSLRRVCKSSLTGFTLVELVVVLVILSILVGVALPTFMGVRGKAYRAEALPIMNELKQMAWCNSLQYRNATNACWSKTAGSKECYYVGADAEILKYFQELGYSSSDIPKTDNWNFTVEVRGNGIWGSSEYPPKLLECDTNGYCFVSQALPRTGSKAASAGAKKIALIMNWTGSTVIAYSQ